MSPWYEDEGEYVPYDSDEVYGRLGYDTDEAEAYDVDASYDDGPNDMLEW